MRVPVSLRRRGAFLPALLAAAGLAAVAAHIARSQLSRGTYADAGSSYRSSPDGARALFLLLGRMGGRAARLQRAPYLDDPRVQLLSIGASPTAGTPRRLEAEAAAIARFVALGGTYIELSPSPREGLVDALAPRGRKPRRAPADRKGRRERPEPPDVPERPAAESGRLRLSDPEGRQVVVSRINFWDAVPAGAEALLRAGNRVAGIRIRHGRGSAVLVGSADPIENGRLSEGENLEFVLSQLDLGRPVLFDEYRHGYDEEETLPGLLARYGLRTLPLQLAVLLLAGILRASAGGPAPGAVVETVKRGARSDLVLAAAALAGRTVPASDAARAFWESASARLAEPGLPPARVRKARARLDDLRRTECGLVEMHRRIVEIEKELESK